MANKYAKVTCPNCGKEVVAYRTSKGRLLITTVAGVGLAIFGAAIGSAFGIATGGWAAPATIPAAAVGLVVGAGAGYIVSDKAADAPRCPKCDDKINLGV